MPLQQFYQNAYQQALRDNEDYAREDAARQSNIKRVYSVGKSLWDMYTAPQILGPWASSAIASGNTIGSATGALGSAPAWFQAPQTLSLGYGGAVPISSVPATTTLGAGIISGLGGTAAGTAAGATSGAASSALAGSAAASGTGAGAGAAAGASGSAASGASSGLMASGIGAAIGLGLAIGSSSPGQTLFPAKKFMYNVMQPIVKIIPGAEWAQRNIINPIFGDPNEQLKEYRSRIDRAVALKHMASMKDATDIYNSTGDAGDASF